MQKHSPRPTKPNHQKMATFQSRASSARGRLDVELAVQSKRIEVLSQKIALREQTLSDYRVIRERSVRKTQRNVAVMAAGAKSRNESFLNDISTLLKEGARTKETFAKRKYVLFAPVSSVLQTFGDSQAPRRSLSKARRGFEDKVEEMYWDWQDDIERRAMEKLQQLEEQKREVAERRSRAKRKKARDEELSRLAREAKEEVEASYQPERAEDRGALPGSRYLSSSSRHRDPAPARGLFGEHEQARVTKEGEVRRSRNDDDRGKDAAAAAAAAATAAYDDDEDDSPSSAMKIRRQENNSISRRLRDQMEKEARAKRQVDLRAMLPCPPCPRIRSPSLPPHTKLTQSHREANKVAKATGAPPVAKKTSMEARNAKILRAVSALIEAASSNPRSLLDKGACFSNCYHTNCSTQLTLLLHSFRLSFGSVRSGSRGVRCTLLE